MGTANRVIKNTFFLYARIAIGAVLSLFTTRIVLNSLGATDFGVFAVVGGAVAMLGFLSNSMTQATQRFMNFYEGEGSLLKQKEIFTVSIIVQIVLALIVAVILIVCGSFLFDCILSIPEERVKAAIYVYACLIISTIFAILSVPYEASIIAHENMKVYAIIGILDAFLKFFIALIISLASNDKLVLYGILMSCVPIINISVLYFYCNIHYKECIFKPRSYWSRGMLKEELAFASWNMLTSITTVFTKHGIGIVLNNFFGVIVNSAQGIANQLSGYLSTFSSSAMKALNPIIVKSEGAGNRERLHYTSLLGCRLAFFLMGFFAIPIIFEMPIILKLWLFNIPEWAVTFCRLQLICTLSEQLINGIATSVYANGNIKYYTIRKGIINILPIPLSAFLFYVGFPPPFIYISLIFCSIIGGGSVILYYAHKLIGLQYAKYFREVFLPTLILVLLSSFTLLVLDCFLTKEYKMIAIISELSVYFFIGWYLCFQKQERSALSKLILYVKNR